MGDIDKILTSISGISDQEEFLTQSGSLKHGDMLR